MSLWLKVCTLSFVGTVMGFYVPFAVANEPVFKEAPVRNECLYEGPIENSIVGVDEKRLSEVKPTTTDECLLIPYLRAAKVDATGDFTHKDPAAARIIGISLERYVIGGMDKDLKVKLCELFKALEKAGFKPGILSGYRGPERQRMITSGVRAGVYNSFHGGSRRDRGKRGWGFGLAADIVNVSPFNLTVEERWLMNTMLWRWIDEHQEYGIGRPYGDYDPAHVAPLGGEECSLRNCNRAPQKVLTEKEKSEKTTLFEKAKERKKTIKKKIKKTKKKT
jgi:hypothetical protein